MASGSQAIAGGRHHERQQDALVIAARQGCVVALGSLFESVRAHLMLAAQRDLPRRFQAQMGASDIVQDAVTAGQRQFHAFRGGTAAEFFGWMRLVLAHSMIDTVRRHEAARRLPGARTIALADIDSGDGRLAARIDDRPEDGAIRAEGAAIVGTAIDSLAPDDRRVLWLRHWQGATFAEIGAEMDRTPDAARKLWCRAFERLEQAIRDVGSARASDRRH